MSDRQLMTRLAGLDAEVVRAVATRLLQHEAELGEQEALVPTAVPARDEWLGPSRAAFLDRTHNLRITLDLAASHLVAAAAVLRRYADTLDEARGLAEAALAAWRQVDDLLPLFHPLHRTGPWPESDIGREALAWAAAQRARADGWAWRAWQVHEQSTAWAASHLLELRVSLVDAGEALRRSDPPPPPVTPVASRWKDVSQ